MNTEDGSFGRGWPLVVLLATMACEREERWRVDQRRLMLDLSVMTNTKTAQASRQLTQAIVVLLASASREE